MANRLHLNFSLETLEERISFLNEYFQRSEFERKPLSHDELETCANYVLWGKDKDGLNFVQKKEMEIETRNKTWTKREDESLEGLLETPGFNENSISSPNGIHKRVPREVFSRAEVRRCAPPYLIEVFEDLWRQIDTLDLIINYYDFEHNKRKNPPREELTRRFSEKEQEELYEQSTHLNQYKYLKMRHLLVDLRRQQFTLRDTFQNTVYRHTQAIPQIDDSIALCPMPLAFETEIQVYPLGLFTEEKLSQQIFQAEPDFENITENDYKNINDFYWAKKTEPKTNFYIDFRELEHVYNLFLLLFDLEDSAAVASANAFTESTTEYLLKTFQFYLDLAQLSEVHREIVDLKIRRVKNQQIADYINEKYDKSYTANYISTIFRQKIIKQINESAAFHEEIVGNIFFPENFKTCTCCGKLLLKDPKNFVRKTRSRDGYSTRCKKCDKESRDRKKIK